MYSTLLALRVWIPGLYGWHLVFVNGTMRGALSDGRIEGLKSWCQASARSSPSTSVSDTLRLLCIDHQLTPESCVFIDPSKSTILSDEDAKQFIPIFYSYFQNVFHEGSPFIDSDGDFLPILERYFPDDATALCMDIGAGSGYYAAALAPKVARVIACDIATERLERLNAPNVEVVRCDIQDLPFSVKADFVMCNFVLEHVADPYKVVSEISRNTVDGGKILLSFPSFALRDVIGAKQHGELPTLNFEHLRSFTGELGVHPWEEHTSRLTDYIAALGFSIIEIRGINITAGLDTEGASQLNAFLDEPSISSTNRPPYNLYGQQTIIYAQKARS